MSDLVPITESKTDPYAPEPTNVAPVHVRLLHDDKTITDLEESKDVLAWPLFLHGGRLYVRRGADGVRHLYREVPEIPRLDAIMTAGERSALQAALTLVTMAQERLKTMRTVTGSTVLADVAAELTRWLGP